MAAKRVCGGAANVQWAVEECFLCNLWRQGGWALSYRLAVVLAGPRAAMMRRVSPQQHRA